MTAPPSHSSTGVASRVTSGGVFTVRTAGSLVIMPQTLVRTAV